MRQDEGYPEIAVNSFNRTEAPYVNVQGDHAKIVRELGAAGLVLLSNKDDILPLSKKIKSIAIVGSDAGPNPEYVLCKPKIRLFTELFLRVVV